MKYQRISVDFLNNGRNENQKTFKITNVDKHKNIRRWRTIDFIYKISEN